VIASFATLAKKHNIALVLDETYRDFILSDVPHHLFSARDGLGNWRETLIHLFSFSKSYCVPGHRLGAIVASPAILSHIATVLDTVLICAPRPIQLALASTLPTLRSFIKENALALASRHNLFKSCLPSAWKIGSQGGYYAFVRHPFKGIPAKEVSQRLALDSGIVTLPVEFFSTDNDENGEKIGRWIRFSVANVDDMKVKNVCARLAEVQETYGWELD
jgi:aspartate/methionine/tyrosine aminotransferase